MVTLFALTACQREAQTTHYGMYYWRTTFQLSEAEQRWMDSMKVETFYLHLFDVVSDSRNTEIGMRPEATIKGLSADSVSKMLSAYRLVPVVFIAPGTISKDMTPRADRIAERLLRRIDDVTEKNGLGTCHEVQIDYDWAESNEKAYFAVLQSLSDRLHKEGRVLSTTIRLHQLALDVPPVDSGVLMCYNTGRLMDITESNSILSRKSVEPYMRYVSSYKLPLRLALPNFSWNVVFREDEFAFIAPGLQLDDTLSYTRLDATHWRSRTYHALPSRATAVSQGDQRILPGDIIRREESSDSLNRDIFDHLTNLRPELADEVIFFP